MKLDLDKDPLGKGSDGKDVYLKDIWPTPDEIEKYIDKYVTRKVFKSRYADVFAGDNHWKGVDAPEGETYAWDMGSTYVQNPPYFEGMTMTPDPITDIKGARILAMFGDKITTDPHLPGRFDQAGLARRHLPRRAPGLSQGLQPVRHPARQSRDHDARHLRQHPHQELHDAA